MDYTDNILSVLDGLGLQTPDSVAEELNEDFRHRRIEKGLTLVFLRIVCPMGINATNNTNIIMRNCCLLFLILWLCLSGCILAQKDVTGLYLTNAKFDDPSDYVGSIVYTYAKDATENGGVSSCQPVSGWTADAAGDAKAGGVFQFGSGFGLSGSGYVIPSSGPSAESGGALGLAGCWGNAVGYSQEVTLPPGLYRFSYKVYNAGPNEIANYGNQFGFVADNEKTFYDDTDFYSGEWTEGIMYMMLTTTTSGRIHVGYSCGNVGSGNTPKLFVDEVKLEVYDASPGYMLESLTSRFGTSPSDWGATGTYSADGVTGVEVFQWAASLPTGKRMSQKVTGLPDGLYRVTVFASVSSTSGRDNTSNVITERSMNYASVHANGVSHGVPAYNRIECGKFDRIVLNDVEVSDGTLEISLNQDMTGPNWLVMQVKDVQCVRPVPLDLRYILGDVNADGVVTIADVTALVDIILGKISSTNSLRLRADVNEDEGITIADVTALVDIILGKSEAKTVDRTYTYADLDAMFYTEQSGTENNGGADYLLNSAVGSITGLDVSEHYAMEDYLTTLHVSTTLQNLESMSVYAIGKEQIAGPMAVNCREDEASYTYSAGDALTYANSLESDVIAVRDVSSNVITAYLRPVSLSKGVKVSIRTTDGLVYSQDFKEITIGEANDLQFTQSSAQNLWMATIPGNTYFSMVSTPGAHDAATSGCTTATYLSRCQADDLPSLLANGVRAFDIRPGYYYDSAITEDNLYIYHGMVSTNVLYKDAIRIFAEFLENHPSEVISVIMVKENNKPTIGGTDRSSEMWNVIDAVHTTYGDYMKVLDHSYYTLDDFRGKICYVNRTGTDCKNTVRITNWPDDSSVTDYSCAIGGTCYANVEDAYNASESDKKTVTTAMLDMASTNTNRARFHYVYTSIAGTFFSSLTGHAAVMNPYTASYISNSLSGPTGYVYADYMGNASNGGAELLKAVVAQNYKYVYKGRTRME